MVQLVPPTTSDNGGTRMTISLCNKWTWKDRLVCYILMYLPTPLPPNCRDITSYYHILHATRLKYWLAECRTLVLNPINPVIIPFIIKERLRLYYINTANNSLSELTLVRFSTRQFSGSSSEFWAYLQQYLLQPFTLFVMKTGFVWQHKDTRWQHKMQILDDHSINSKNQESKVQ